MSVQGCRRPRRGLSDKEACAGSLGLLWVLDRSAIVLSPGQTGGRETQPCSVCENKGIGDKGWRKKRGPERKRGLQKKLLPCFSLLKNHQAWAGCWIIRVSRVPVPSQQSARALRSDCWAKCIIGQKQISGDCKKEKEMALNIV